MNRSSRRSVALLIVLIGASTGISGCDVLNAIKGGNGLPTGELARVDLIQSPTTAQATTWGCYEYVGAWGGCSVLGSKPSDSEMQMSFDLVFDLTNNSDSIPIPLVEILLGLSVYEGENLGVTCISFCDPDDEDCTPQTDAEGSCQAENADDVSDGGDLVPSVDELVGIGEDVANGGVDNWDFKYIPPNETIEAHIQFDLGTDVTLGLGQRLLEDAVTDALAGRDPAFEIPYAAEGTLFFDIADARKGLGFGPFESVWNLE